MVVTGPPKPDRARAVENRPTPATTYFGYPQNLLRRTLPAVNAVRQADPAKSAAGHLQTGQQGQAGLDPGNALLVADVILGHRPRPMGDVAEYRLALDPQERPQMLQDQRQELGVGHFRQIGPPRPADKDPQQRLPRRGTMRIFLTAEAASQNRAVFDRRHHRPHAVQRMPHLPHVVAQRDDRRARVLDLPQFRRQFRIDRGEQRAGAMRRHGHDQGVEFQELGPCPRGE